MAPLPILTSGPEGRADDSGLREEAPARERWEAWKAPRDRFRRWLFNGARPEPVPSHLGPVEPPEPERSGICCSGGGVRSAAFSLGALQALQEAGELERARYLAAVSGGSYIAAAISTVARSDGERDSDRALLDRVPPFAPGSPEEQYLRSRCSYLAPTFTDKLYLAWRVVLGVAVNLLFLSVPLVGLTLVLTGLLYVPLLPDLAGACGPAAGGEGGCAANIPAAFWAAPVAALGLGVASGAMTLLRRWRSSGWERFFAIWAARLLVLAAALAVALVGLPYLLQLSAERWGADSEAMPEIGKTAIAIGSGFAALLAGGFAQLARLLASEKAVEGLGTARKALGGAASRVGLALAYAAGGLIGPLILFAAVFLALAEGMAQAAPSGDPDPALAGAGIAVLAVFAVAYWFADLTTWSLHPYYKRRLSSAFSLKRVGEEALDDEERRRVEALRQPGDDEGYAGIAVERGYDDLVRLSETALSEPRAEAEGRGREWPTLLVCAAANVSDPGATPPGRSVTSFTFSAHTIGGPLVGGVRTKLLERAFENRSAGEAAASASEERGVGFRRSRDLTLPAAVAMSGAAISPSMGKMTKRPLTFLMALLNVRLGVWVPNPRWVGAEANGERLSRRYGRPRPSYLLRELLGRNRIADRYLYVTDGGHYENLGLVELLRRGCTEVYCFDASGVGKGDVEFKALGDAIALARSELGVEIEFDTDPAELAPDGETGVAKRDVVRGEITYPDRRRTRGTLVYVRNTLTAEVPWDVKGHHNEDPRFPHDSTIDQLYTDQKFEAYRVLGERAGGRALEEMGVA